MHVWRRDGFRATVRRVEDEDTRLFMEAEELARYLEASVRRNDDPGDGEREDGKR